MSLFTVQELQVKFEQNSKGEEAVRSLSFQMDAGEIIGIVGESGSGKSTVMRAIMGLLPTDAEVACKSMTIGETDITPPRGSAGGNRAYQKELLGIRGKRIAMVFQNPTDYLNPTVKVGRQLAETVRMHEGCSRNAAKIRAAELLEMTGIYEPDKRLGQYPFELSGGLCQRVAIAIALAGRPELILADEPTTALDATVQKEILELFQRIAQDTGTAILFVSHDLGAVAELCKRVLIMRDGRLVEEGLAEEVFCNPSELYTKQLLEKARALRTQGRQKKTAEPILQVENISKDYTGAEAVSEVSLSIGKGETYGLVGESGCGKTTLAGMITGLVQPSGGQIIWEGNSEKKNIQMIFQNPYASLNPRMTLEEILEEPLLINGDTEKDVREAKIQDILRLTGLSAIDKRKYPRAFSGGERQRIAIARAFLTSPQLIVCDEPVSALDTVIQEQILELLERIQEEQGTSYLFISHDLNVVKRISHRIGVMYGGSLMEAGTAKEIYQEPWHPYTKMLLEAVPELKPWKTKKKRGFRDFGSEKTGEIQKGCPFAGKCGYALAPCFQKRPQTYWFDRRMVSCFLYSEEHMGKGYGDSKMTSQI